MTKFLEFLKSESTPRWQLFLGAFIVWMAGFAQTEVYFRRTAALTEIASQQEQIEGTFLEIQKNSIDFQTYANAYVSAVLDGVPDAPERRDALINNILAQDAVIDVSRPILGEAMQAEVAEYREALRNMKSSVEGVTDIQTMRPFWQAAANLLEARNDLLQALEAYTKSIGA